MNSDYAEAIRTTFRSAMDIRRGETLTPSQLEGIVDYAYSPASGARDGESLEQMVRRRYEAHPARLSEGMRYVAYSCTDRMHRSNGDAARAHVQDSTGRAGTIGHTPWGKFVSAEDVDPELSTALGRLKVYLDQNDVTPAYGTVNSALLDTLWNYGSAPFMENAIRSGLPIVGFVDGASEWRGFSRHELPTLLRSPDTMFNGYAIRDIAGDPRQFTGDASAQLQSMEWRVVNAASMYSNRLVPPSEFHRMVDLSYGLDAAKGTLFGMPYDQFIRQSLPEMAQTAHTWSRHHAQAHENPHYRTPLDELQDVAREGAHARGIRFNPTGDGAGSGSTDTGGSSDPDAKFSRGALTKPLPGTRVVGMAGQAALGADALMTARSVSSLNDAGNGVGVDSELVHFGARNLGAWGGAVLGAKTAAALGAETGPGAIVAGLAGGVIGAASGEAVARAIDDARTFHQKDRDGHLWHMDPHHPDRGWTRTESTMDFDGPRVPGVGHGAPTYRTQTIHAPADVASELDYRASNVQVQLALAHPAEPRDPNTVPSIAADTPSLRRADWQRSPSGDWSRQVTTGYLEHGLPVSHPERAAPGRSHTLDDAAARIVAENQANEPQAIAERYMEAWRENGWDRFGPPEAAAAAMAQPDIDRSRSMAAMPLSSRAHESTPAVARHADTVPDEFEARVDWMLDAMQKNDWDRFDRGVHAFAAEPAAQEMLRQAQVEVDHQEQLAEQARRIAEQQQQIEALQQQQAQQQTYSRSMSR